MRGSGAMFRWAELSAKFIGRVRLIDDQLRRDGTHPLGSKLTDSLSAAEGILGTIRDTGIEDVTKKVAADVTKQIKVANENLQKILSRDSAQVHSAQAISPDPAKLKDALKPVKAAVDQAVTFTDGESLLGSIAVDWVGKVADALGGLTNEGDPLDLDAEISGLETGLEAAVKKWLSENIFNKSPMKEAEAALLAVGDCANYLRSLCEVLRDIAASAEGAAKDLEALEGWNKNTRRKLDTLREKMERVLKRCLPSPSVTFLPHILTPSLPLSFHFSL